MDTFSSQADVDVSFQSLSGENYSTKVSCDITGVELHQLAASMFCRDVKLFLECAPLAKDWQQPLLAIQQPVVVMQTILGGSTVVDSLINSIQRGCFDSASLMLQRQPKVAMLRDSSDNTTLAWAAYCARRSPHPLDLINCLLNKAKPLVRVACNGLRFLPLHEAALGNAPTSVAVLLCAAYPAAVHMKAKDGSTPHDVGRYHHGIFAWPCVDKLLEMAKSLRTQLKTVRSLKAARRSATVNRITVLKPQFLDAAIVGCFGLPHSLATRVAEFVGSFVLERPRTQQVAFEADSQAESVNNTTLDNDINPMSTQIPFDGRKPEIKSQRQRRRVHDMRCAGPRRQHPSRGRCARVSTCSQQTDLESVEHIREAAPKEQGQFAGLHRARHRKCSFQTVTEVAVGVVVHRLLSHTVRAVREKDIECRMTWPEKKQLWKDRARDRDVKYDDMQRQTSDATLDYFFVR